MVMNRDMPRADADQILDAYVGSDETVRFLQTPRSRDIHEKMDPRCRVSNLGTPGDPKRLEQFDGSPGGEGQYSGRWTDAQRWEVPGRRPGAEVTNRHAWRRRGVVSVAHGRRHGPDRLVVGAVSCAHLERVQPIRQVERLVRERVRLVGACVD